MIRRPPRSTRPDTLFPYTTLFRSLVSRNATGMFYVPKTFLAAAAAPLILVSPAFGQNTEQPGRYELSGPRYADLADLVLAAPMIVDAVIGSVVRIKGEEAAGVALGMMRFYVNHDVTTLIRGLSGIHQNVGYQQGRAV